MSPKMQAQAAHFGVNLGDVQRIASGA
jgi:hypothetical protein